MNTTPTAQKEFSDKNKKFVVDFQRENCKDCFEEALPLLVDHWNEVAYIEDIKLEPEFATYELLEKTNRLRTYTARLEGKLIGYAVFFFQHHIHFKSSLFALCDIIYISPKHRGFGHKFIRWCNDNLLRDGAKCLYYYVNKRYDYGVVLRRQGFKHSDDGYIFQIKE